MDKHACHCTLHNPKNAQWQTKTYRETSGWIYLHVYWSTFAMLEYDFVMGCYTCPTDGVAVNGVTL